MNWFTSFDHHFLPKFFKFWDNTQISGWRSLRETYHPSLDEKCIGWSFWIFWNVQDNKYFRPLNFFSTSLIPKLTDLKPISWQTFWVWVHIYVFMYVYVFESTFVLGWSLESSLSLTAINLLSLTKWNCQDESLGCMTSSCTWIIDPRRLEIEVSIQDNFEPDWSLGSISWVHISTEPPSTVTLGWGIHGNCVGGVAAHTKSES